MAHALDDLATVGFHSAVEFGDVSGNEGTKGAAVAREAFGKFGALILDKTFEDVDLTGEGVLRSLGLADDFGNKRIDGYVEGFVRLIAADENALCQLIADRVKLAAKIGCAQIELRKEGIPRIYERAVDVVSARSDVIDHDSRTLTEFAGGTIEALVEHVVHAIGKIGELLVHMTGLEIEAGSQPLAGV